MTARRVKKGKQQQCRHEECSLAAAASYYGDGLFQSKAGSERKLTDVEIKSITQGFLGMYGRKMFRLIWVAAAHKYYHRSRQETLKLPLYESDMDCILSGAYYEKKGAGLDKTSILVIVYQAMH